LSVCRKQGKAIALPSMNHRSAGHCGGIPGSRA
jgi:hypothetical protein